MCIRDSCNTSDEDERTEDCSNERRFSILVREDPSSPWIGKECGDSELAEGEVCVRTEQYAGTPWQFRYLAHGSDVTGDIGWTDSSWEEAILLCNEMGFDNARVVWPDDDLSHAYTYFPGTGPVSADGIWSGHIAANIPVQREVVCW